MSSYRIPPHIINDILSNRAPAGPLQSIINITTHCNLRCEFCWHHSPLLRKQKAAFHAVGSDILNIINDLAKMGTKMVLLGADGEPTAHPMFIDFVKAIKKHRMQLILTSNLSFRAPKLVSAFSQADRIILNLAAVDAASYRSVHSPKAPDTFKQVIKNIKFFSHLYTRHGHPKLEVDYVLTKNNFRQIDNAIELARSCGAPSLAFRTLRSNEQTRSLSINEHEREELVRDIARIIRKPTAVHTNLRDLLKTLNPKNKTTPRFQHCFIGWLTITINQNGDVGLCCQHNRLNIGNWKKNTLPEIWNSTVAHKRRNQARNSFNPNAPFWRDCRSCLFSDNNIFIDQVLKKYKKRAK